MDIYSYISEAKLTALQAAAPGFLSALSAEVTLKVPFLEGKLSGAKQASVVTELERIVARLKAEEQIISFDDVTSKEMPKIMCFSGEGGRLVDGDAFWLAMKGERNALLLAGSAGYAIGKPASTSAYISPSADPVNALRVAFGQGHESPGQSIASSLSYAWQEIARENLVGVGGVPRVEGIVFAARTLPVDKEQFSSVGCENLSLLVVGTPLYVKQL
jgi:hypothetical protein